MANNNPQKPKLSKAQQEARQILRQFRLIIASAVLLLIGGMVFYYFIEDFSLVDSFYFSVISFTTVGYGDIFPRSDAGKLFTAVYVLTGVIIFGALINNLIKSRDAKRIVDDYRHQEQNRE